MLNALTTKNLIILDIVCGNKIIKKKNTSIVNNLSTRRREYNLKK